MLVKPKTKDPNDWGNDEQFDDVVFHIFLINCVCKFTCCMSNAGRLAGVPANTRNTRLTVSSQMPKVYWLGSCVGS